MDILTLDCAQMTRERRKPLITRGGEEIERRVKPERINQTIDMSLWPDFRYPGLTPGRRTRMTTIKEWLRAAGRDLDQHFTTARDKLLHAHRVASEKVTSVAHRAAENVGTAYQAAKPHVEAAVVYAAPRVRHGVKYAAIQVLRFVINAERQFLDYVEAHLPKEDEAGPPLAEPSPVEPVALPQARIFAAGGKNEDDGGKGLDLHLQA